MSWMSVLKKGPMGNRGIQPKQKEFVDELMSDYKKRTPRKIVEDLYDKLEEINAERAAMKPKQLNLSSNIIAPTTQIKRYISHNPKYESAVYDSITGKILAVKRLSKPHHEIKYWMK